MLSAARPPAVSDHASPGGERQVSISQSVQKPHQTKTEAQTEATTHIFTLPSDGSAASRQKIVRKANIHVKNR